MRVLSSVILAILMLAQPVSGLAQVTTTLNKGGQKDPLLTRVSDWFATAGKTQEEKYVIMKNRRAARKVKQAQKNIARKKKGFARQRARSEGEEVEKVTVK